MGFERCLRDVESNFMRLEVMALVTSGKLINFVASSRVIICLIYGLSGHVIMRANPQLLQNLGLLR